MVVAVLITSLFVLNMLSSSQTDTSIHQIRLQFSLTSSQLPSQMSFLYQHHQLMLLPFISLFSPHETPSHYIFSVNIQMTV